MRDTDSHRAALKVRLAEVRRGVVRGWAFTPQHGKRCFRSCWQTEAPLPLEDIEHLARAGNVAIRTGQTSGVVVIDDDTAVLNAAVLLELPETPTVETGSGKKHHYYRQPGFPVRNSTGRLLPGVDVKGERGAATFVGSIHPDTHRMYRWIPGLSPDDIEVAALPEHILERLRPAEVRRPIGPLAVEPCAGSRPERYAAGALRGAALRVYDAHEGSRNSTLNREAFGLTRFVAAGLMSRERVEDVLAEAARAAGLPDTEIACTLRSAIDSGLLNSTHLAMPEART